MDPKNQHTQSPIFGEPFKKALVYASDLHANQTRKGTHIPYITHLLAVASLVGECGGTEDEVISALLHDAVEDQGGKEIQEEIKSKFGNRVLEIVLECSDTDVTPKPPWKERKTNYLNHLQSCNDPSVILVSSADKLHNLRSIYSDFLEIGDEIWKRFNASKEETLWYYGELVKIYKTKDAPQRILVELDRLLNSFKL